MTEIKIDGKLTAAVESATSSWADQMFSKRAGRWVFVGELAHVERVEPGDALDKARTVKVRVTHCEIPEPEHEPAVRQLLQDLHTLRTAHGTLEMAMPYTHTVTRDRVAKATDNMIWPPRPGDLWRDATGRQLFVVGGVSPLDLAFMSGEGETLLVDDVLQMEGGVTLVVRQRPPRADDAEDAEQEADDDGQDTLDYDADQAEDDDRGDTEGAELAEDGAR